MQNMVHDASASCAPQQRLASTMEFYGAFDEVAFSNGAWFATKDGGKDALRRKVKAALVELGLDGQRARMQATGLSTTVLHEGHAVRVVLNAPCALRPSMD